MGTVYYVCKYCKIPLRSEPTPHWKNPDSVEHESCKQCATAVECASLRKLLVEWWRNVGERPRYQDPLEDSYEEDMWYMDFKERVRKALGYGAPT